MFGIFIHMNINCTKFNYSSTLLLANSLACRSTEAKFSRNLFLSCNPVSVIIDYRSQQTLIIHDARTTSHHLTLACIIIAFITCVSFAFLCVFVCDLFFSPFRKAKQMIQLRFVSLNMLGCRKYDKEKRKDDKKSICWAKVGS